MIGSIFIIGFVLGADSGSIGFYNDMLYRLKKELQE